MNSAKVLVIGASGQLGTELVTALEGAFGVGNVVGADLKRPDIGLSERPFELLDATKMEQLVEVVKRHNITQVYHLAALLSGTSEKEPLQAWNINMTSLLNVLELARHHRLEKVFWPSSIAVFGPSTPKQKTPQKTANDPTSVYGISKYAGELWCNYYFKKYGVDVRSIRYPGLIGWKAKPGGGTTDFAVDIYFQAAQKKQYTCFLSEKTYLPMMYMDDAVQATMQLMESKAHNISERSGYNVGAMSLCPEDMANSIKKIIPDFEIDYEPDFRQAIADSWPSSIDDAPARHDWGWSPKYDLDAMTNVMLSHCGSGILL